jgi:uncharacterized protein (TIGR00255 family)
MVASMTAFARQTGEGDWSQSVWELRSVNHRYLDISIKLPEGLRGLESLVRERISACLNRGKIECTLRHDLNVGEGKLSVNWDVARRVTQAASEVAALLPQSAPINPLDVLRWPGVIANDLGDVDALATKILSLLDRALETLVATRLREGEKLRALLESRCSHAIDRVGQLRQQLPQILAKIGERYRERLQELGPSLDPGRLEQEMLLTAQKLDVAEELDRLDTHIAEVRRLLQENGPNGRRLDFLMQELNREANTIASKSGHVDSTGAAVDLKVLIEQMREQIQNIE